MKLPETGELFVATRLHSWWAITSNYKHYHIQVLKDEVMLCIGKKEESPTHAYIVFLTQHGTLLFWPFEDYDIFNDVNCFKRILQTT